MSAERSEKKPAEPMPLFRPQSLAARRTAWVGRPRVAIGVPTHVAAVASILALVGAALLIAFGTYTRRVDVVGVVTPVGGLTRIAAPATGWISTQYVTQGERIARGDVALDLRIGLEAAATDAAGTEGDDRVVALLRARVAEIDAEIEGRRDVAARERAQALSRAEALTAEADVIEALAARHREMEAVTRASLERIDALQGQGLTTSNAMDDARRDLLAQQMQMDTLARERARLAGEIVAAREQAALVPLRLEATIADLRSTRLALESQVAEAEARREVGIVAPRDGVVVAIAAQIGQSVRAGEPLLTLAPADAAPQVDLLVPGRAMGFLRPGADVRLRYDAFPYQTFGQFSGEVRSISRAPLTRDELAAWPGADAAAAGDTMFRVVVAPDRHDVPAYGVDEPLQPGMQARASIAVDRRPVWQWLFEPLLALGQAA